MRRYLFCVNILKLCSNNVKMKTFIYEISISLCIAILQSKTSFSSGLTTRSYTKSWQNKPGQHSIQESETKIFKSQLSGSHENSSVRECQNCIVYVNGDYLPAQEAKISVLDRGFMFADSVYEVTAVLAGKLLDNDYHVARLHRSLNELNIPAPFVSDHELLKIQQEIIARNHLQEGLIYLQASRGPVSERDFLFPSCPDPTLVVIPQHKGVIKSSLADRGARVITVEDIRWGRRDIKTTQLLAQSMAKQAAYLAGVDDAWLFETDTGHVTEGSSANAYILTHDNCLITRNLGNDILPGITRRVVLSLAHEYDDIKLVVERPFTVAEALQAKEAFSTSSTSFVMPVVEIDGKPIGTGEPGPVAIKLRQLYIERALSNSSRM